MRPCSWSQSPDGGNPLPPITQQAVVKSFDRVAAIYEPLERILLGRQLERARTCLLPVLKRQRHVLIIGEGDGRLLSTLLAELEGGRITVVDSSKRMLRLARRRIDSDPRVTFCHADATQTLPSGPFDAVVTAFVLDCFEAEQLGQLISELYRTLAPGGLWLLADFVLDGRGLVGLRQRVWVSALYSAFRCLTDISARRLVDPRPLLLAQGLQRTHRQSCAGGLVETSVWQRPAERR